MIQAIEQNRNAALLEVASQMVSATPDQKHGLEAMRESIWMQEEQDRRHADFYRRDCLKAAAK